MKINIVVLFINFGPYHIARVFALKNIFKGDVFPVQITNNEMIREWRLNEKPFDILTLLKRAERDVFKSDLRKILYKSLHNISPDILAIAGYSHPAMRFAAIWAKKHNKLAILMSESQYIDKSRNLLIEKIKGWWIKRYFDSAFVGGERSADYLIKLGFPADKIWRGYDVVDNEYFSKKAEEIRKNGNEWRLKLELPDKYFLYVGRFSPEKNLLKLLEAYRIYKNKMQKDAWGLVLVGSGPQENELKSKADKLGLRQIIFPGFKQINELPLYYALSSCFILPSNSEPWGLVVNEAMASGLPVLVSYKCGCVPELVYPGINGYTFNPENVEEIAFYMSHISSGGVDINKMGEASRKIIQNFSAETWARALADCIEVTMKRRNRG
ncbi:MAG: glycosyltransferase family 4 protein [candidate division WOR-3 bacterium]